MAFYDFNQLTQPIAATEFVEIPDGQHPFTIKEIDRDYYQGNSASIEKGCPFLTLTMDVELPDGQTGQIRDRLYLQDKFLWKIATLMRALGEQPNADGHFVPKLDDSFLLGKQGILESAKNTYVGTDGKDHTSYNVKKYVAPNVKPQQMNMGVGAMQGGKNYF